MSRLFGTDGIRGVANASLTPELAFRLGRAGAAVLARTSPADHPIVVGRDTRLSGTMLECALVAGILSVGRDALQIGVVPTPAVAQVTRMLDAAAGVMISASHNPIEDNGIKFFGADGFKLSDEIEDEIEAALASDELPRPTHHDVGIARPAHALVDRYFTNLIAAGGDLRGMTIVVDAANGAAYESGPSALTKLGATVVTINAENDGARINVACGATDLRPLAARVREIAATGVAVVGVAFDGDADRALFVDETGQTLSGDHVMLILAREWKKRGMLARDTIVGTVMSNVGLERALQAEGIHLKRAAVGDRYVLEEMRAGGFVLGGEQSGHIIDLGRNTTGDGPMTAISLFSIVAASRRSLHELASALTVFPQVLVNIRVADRAVAQDAEVLRATEEAASELGDSGRILVRASGTEALMRVMVEGPDDATIGRIAERVAAVIRERSHPDQNLS